MSEPVDGDELRRLRAADPVKRAGSPAPTGADARALFAAITQNEPATPVAEVSDGRKRWIVLVAAVVLVVVGGAATSLLREATGNTDAEIASGDPTSEPTSDPISPGGTHMGGCVELYDLRTLANRQMAFDGTVARVEGDDVTFTVNEWYRGSNAAEVTLAGASTLSGHTSAGSATPLEPGTRLLVAGDGGFAWSCGFTQPYDPAVAEQWAATFAG